MAALDLARIRDRVLPNSLSYALSAGALCWVGYLTWIYARDAYRTGETERLVSGLDVVPELQVILAAGAIAVAAGVAGLLRKGLLYYVRLLMLAAAVVAAGVLTVTSGQVGEVLALVGLLAWSWFVGGAAVAAIELRSPLFEAWSRVAVEAALGLAIMSYGILVLALLGLIDDPGLGFLFVAGAAIGTALRWRLRPPLWRPAQASPEDTAGLELAEFAALGLIAVTMVATFGASLAPQMHPDALHYHFAIPRFLLSEGRFVERLDIVQSYFPLGMEMTYVPALRLGGETTMTLVHWAYAPMTVALLWSGGNRYFGRPAGAFAAALFALTPLFFSESITATSDLAMTFWLAATAIALAGFAVRPSTQTAGFTGLTGGLALTFKIVSGIYLIPIALAFGALLAAARQPLSTTARRGLAFTMAGLLAGGPWLLIRAVQTGNPVFPLFNDVFRSEKWPPVHERFDLWLFGIGHSASDLLNVWQEVTLHPWNFGQGMPTWSVGPAGLVFVAALACIPLLAKDRARVLILALAVLSALSWFYLSQYHRYGLPAFALMALCGGGVIALFLSKLPRPASAAAGTALVGAWFAASTILALIMVDPRPYPTDVVLGHETRQEFRDRLTPGYPALVWLDRATEGTGEGALMLGYVYNYFVRTPLFEWHTKPEISEARAIVDARLPDEEMARALVRANIRWLVVRTVPLPYEEPWPPAFLAETVLSPSFLTNHTEQAFQKYDVVIYRILDR